MIEINLEEHARFIRYLARLYKHPDVDIEDALSIANTAMLKAANRFNPDRGKPFRSYAYKVIKHELWKLKPLRPENEVLTDMDNAGDLKKEYKLLTKITQISVSRRLAETTEQQVKFVLLAKLESLPDREKFILKRSFGIDCESKTYMEIAKEMGIAYQRVHQLKTRGLQMLRTLMMSETNHHETTNKMSCL